MRNPRLCFGLDYYEIHERWDIDVSGGLTFARPEHSSQPEETKGMWIVGFDTLHAGDDMDIWPDQESVMREAERLKRQLEAI